MLTYMQSPHGCTLEYNSDGTLPFCDRGFICMCTHSCTIRGGWNWCNLPSQDLVPFKFMHGVCRSRWMGTLADSEELCRIEHWDSKQMAKAKSTCVCPSEFVNEKVLCFSLWNSNWNPCQELYISACWRKLEMSLYLLGGGIQLHISAFFAYFRAHLHYVIIVLPTSSDIQSCQ